MNSEELSSTVNVCKPSGKMKWIARFAKARSHIFKIFNEILRENVITSFCLPSLATFPFRWLERGTALLSRIVVLAQNLASYFGFLGSPYPAGSRTLSLMWNAWLLSVTHGLCSCSQFLWAGLGLSTQAIANIKEHAALSAPVFSGPMLYSVGLLLDGGSTLL